MGRFRVSRAIVRPPTIRHLLVWVALAALASFGLAKYRAVRDFRARAGPSETLLRPIFIHHEYGLRSDLACAGTNWQTALGHLSRSLRHLGLACRATWHDRTLPRDASVGARFQIPARNSLWSAGAEWRFFVSSSRLVAKQRLMASYHARLIDYYQSLLDEHRVALPPLPSELLEARRTLTATLRVVCDDPGLELEPEPLPEFLPGWKPPTGWRKVMVGDSY